MLFGVFCEVWILVYFGSFEVFWVILQVFWSVFVCNRLFLCWVCGLWVFACGFSGILWVLIVCGVFG